MPNHKAPEIQCPQNIICIALDKDSFMSLRKKTHPSTFQDVMMTHNLIQKLDHDLRGRLSPT
jgi:hypothetical protein